MIEFKNVIKTFSTSHGEVCALNNVSFLVPKGEIFGVIGRSGAGKSTLIRCANLLERPTSGEVWVDEQELTQLSEKELLSFRRRIGMIFQQFNLLSSKTVYENIALPLHLANCQRSEIENAIAPLLEITGLQDKKHRYPAELSGGQKQRVAIARALANKPSILLSDEATSSLDPETTQSILNLLKDINKNLGVTILLITHEMDVVRSICDKVALIEHGKIARQANVYDFFTKSLEDENSEFFNQYLQDGLPDNLKNQLSHLRKANSNPILRIYFRGAAADKPLISHLIKNLNLEVNILYGHVDHIKGQPMGVMVIEVCSAYDDAILQHCIGYLRGEGLVAEVMGYVERNNNILG